MAVYKKAYRSYQGPRIAPHARWLVLPRFLLADLSSSKFLGIFFLVSLIWPLLSALIIYFQHNLSAFQLIRIDVRRLISIDASYFMNYQGFQCVLAFFFATFIGPGLIAPDLANNALPLYLSRPITRTEYVGGKFAVLAGLLSAITSIPGLLLFALQAYLEGGNWMMDNLRIASGIFFGCWIWILLLSFQALALSAWVKWKPVAGGLMFGVFFVLGGFGGMINEVMRTKWGHLINVSHLIGSVWVWLFEAPMKRGAGAWFFRVAKGEEMPIWCSWVALGVLCAICVYLLARRIRGVEVVR